MVRNEVIIVRNKVRIVEKKLLFCNINSKNHGTILDILAMLNCPKCEYVYECVVAWYPGVSGIDQND